jgi:hypothetical protein
MGLDCYIQIDDKAFEHEDIKDVNLCGGMFSGQGNNGSFRGKVYSPLMDHVLGQEGTWYHEGDEVSSSCELVRQAEALAQFLSAYSPGDRIKLDDRIIIDDETDEEHIFEGEEYSYDEVKDLETLLRVAGENGATLHSWW